MKAYLSVALLLLAACPRNDFDAVCKWANEWDAAADERLAEGPPLTSEQREALDHAQGEVERIRKRRHCND